MAEFNMPKYVYKNESVSLDECYSTLAELSYKSPVNIVYQGCHTQLEGDIYKAIQSYGVCVDKDELIKALQYDRDQYKKGYADGCRCGRGKINSEVAKEIFEEIEKLHLNFSSQYDAVMFAELKKKYTEEYR